MKTVLKILKEKISETDTQIQIVKLSREIRQELNIEPKTLIRDIRLMFTYNLPKSLLYLNRYADLVLILLIKKNFLCPIYHHLYIRIGNSKNEALENVVFTEEWNTYGIAVINEERLLKADHKEQQELVLNAINDGLLDIAELDKLDKTKVIEAINEARHIGILSEIIIKTKENNKIAFAISTKTILGQNEDEIYFTIIDKDTNIIARWKFGQENIFLIGGWFGTINVTNKKITIKPKANMDLILEGKQKIIELDIEKVFADPTKITQNSR
jgi:hypothetical protein